ncbi:hypothetical protein NDU88_003269 [Pleurodeles waltl]|uniref:Uncharacterized protein n=1 Tax=Pleurodeles waltl TaxID=8319 RepID=A0AAV7W6W7_PLEWA|nr:hypothetical protein NDU88_003269 [Pleurodeles waltl]
MRRGRRGTSSAPAGLWEMESRAVPVLPEGREEPRKKILEESRATSSDPCMSKWSEGLFQRGYSFLTATDDCCPDCRPALALSLMMYGKARR